MRSQVAVGGDHVYAANLTGQVFSLDFTYSLHSMDLWRGNPVRSAIVLGPVGCHTPVHPVDVETITVKAIWEEPAQPPSAGGGNASIRPSMPHLRVGLAVVLADLSIVRWIGRNIRVLDWV